MFGLLLKKQLYEVFRGWFYDAKTGKARPKESTVVRALLFALLIVVVLGGAFSAIAIGLARPLYSAGAAWLYFDLFSLMAAAAGLFGSVFNTYSGLYLAKDNDLLLSLPIPVGTVIASRVVNVYLMGALYSAVVFVPAVVVYHALCGFQLRVLVGNIVMVLEISLIVWACSCLLGFAVAKISLRLKNRSFVAVLSALVFMGLYYFVYFKAQVVLQDMAAHAAQYGARIQGSAYVLYLWGQNGMGALSPAVLCLAACAALAGLTWLILKKTFLNIATAVPQEKKATAASRREKAQCPDRALWSRELSRFTASANYMLNCGLGVVLLPAAGVALLIKGGALVSALSEAGGVFRAVLPVGAAGIGCMLASMNDMAAPSVSLEGKSLWLIQSLPVTPWQVIRAKTRLQLALTALPMAVFCVCAVAVLPLSTAEAVLCVVALLVFTVFSALFDMCIGLAMPMTEWSSEIVPIKQSGGVAIALFGGWVYAVVMVGGYIGLSLCCGSVSAAGYLGVFAAVTAAVCVWLYRWLKTAGAEALRSLG